MVYGEKRRVVTFQLDSELKRNLFTLSKQLNFNQFVMEALEAEWNRRNTVTTEFAISTTLGRDTQ